MNDFAMYRHRAGLTQVEAAQRLGVDKSTVAKWETGKAVPYSGTLARISGLYGCTVGQLLGLEKAGAVNDGQ